MKDAVFACAASLAADAQVKAGGVEVIVVESSGDTTAKELAAAYPFVRVIALARRHNAAEARNIGARAARAPLLSFIDADCTAPDGFIDAILAAHADQDAPVAGAVLPTGDEDAAGFVLFCIEFSAQLPRRGGAAREVRSAPTCNLSLRRDELLAAGGFPEEHERSHDLAFCARWLAAGRAPFRFDPAVRVQHHGPRGARAVAQHLFVLGRASARVRARDAAARALPGQVFLKLPLLTPLLVPYRFCAVALRLARAEDGARLGARFVSLAPIALLGLSTWALGFWAGARSSAQ